jgi:alpha-tubulin suppressor-like RCC1 family protein
MHIGAEAAVALLFVLAIALLLCPGTDAVAGGCAGYDHVCAITDSASLKCWGGNGAGQLGLGDYAPRGSSPDTVPAPFVGVSGLVASVGCGIGFTCALTTTGMVYCWGNNTQGQLGLGSSVDSVTSPTLSVRLSGAASSLCVGAAFACASSGSSHALQCWGMNDVGQLCAGDSRSRGSAQADFPLPVVATSAGMLACGAGHAMALIGSSGTPVGWGDNRLGQLALGTSAPPNDRVGVSPGARPQAAKLYAPVVAMALGTSHSCFLMTNYSLSCSGANSQGQLGYPGVESIGTTLESVPAPPVDVGFVPTVVAAYAAHTCAGGGTPPGQPMPSLACWGANDQGQLGTGTTVSGVGLDPGSMPPLVLAGVFAGSQALLDGPACAGTTIVTLTAQTRRGGNATVAPHLVTREVLAGWGDGISGQLLAGAPLSRPLLVPSLLNVECGDLVVDSPAGEECDLGLASDGQSCTTFCLSAPCAAGEPCEPCYLSATAVGMRSYVADLAGCFDTTVPCAGPKPRPAGAVCSAGVWSTQALTNAGLLPLGQPLLVKGDYTQLPNATLSLSEGASITATGVATLAGTLELLSDPTGARGPSPPPPPNVTVISAPTIQGTFSTVVPADGGCATQSVTPATQSRLSALVVSPSPCHSGPNNALLYAVTGVIGASALLVLITVTLLYRYRLLRCLFREIDASERVPIRDSYVQGVVAREQLLEQEPQAQQ